MAKLGDVCTLYSGTGFPVQYQGNSSGEFPFYKVGDIAKNVMQGFVFLSLCENYIDKEVCKKIKGTIIPKNTVVFAKIGEAVRLNRRAITTIPCLIDNNAMGIKPNEDIMDLRYFYHFMCDLKLEEYAEATTVPSVKKTIVEKIEIQLPPIETQHQIAENLDKVTRTIDLCNAILEKLDLLVKARFVEMFGGIHDSNLYSYQSVDTFTNVLSGGTPDRKNNDYWKNGTIPWIKTTELHNNVIREAEENITENGLDKSSAKLVPKGTILIAMYGQGKTRGMTALLDIESSTNQACACILPCDRLNQIYLWQYFILSYDKLRDLAKGGNQPNLNVNIIKKFPVLIPPLTMQQQFSAFVEQTDKSKSAVKQVLEKAETLKKALMQEYFG